MTQEIFHLRKLFRARHKINLSVTEIAEAQGVSEEQAQKLIDQDVQAGMVIENRTCGTLHLSFKGLSALAYQ